MISAQPRPMSDKVTRRGSFWPIPKTTNTASSLHDDVDPAFEGAACRLIRTRISDASLQSSSRSMSNCTSSTGAVGSELTDDGESRHEHADGDQDLVVVAVSEEPWQVIETDSEAFHDAEQLEHLEVVRRRFARRTAFGGQLSIEVLEEPRRRSDRPARRTQR
jgi:hypothetical protein